MFNSARLRLTLWLTLLLGLILVATSSAAYLSSRTALYDQVNADLQSRAEATARQVMVALDTPNSDTARALDLVRRPEAGTFDYFYALARPTGDIVASTPGTESSSLADAASLERALTSGRLTVETRAPAGEALRVHVLRLPPRPSMRPLLLEVGRSIEREEQALATFLTVLLTSSAGGMVLVLLGSYWLAGRAMQPIRLAMNSQRDFIANASHELRTPLAVIRANAELLQRQSAQAPGIDDEALDDMIAETSRLGRLVGQLLTLAQADANQLRLPLREVALDELVEDVARGLRILADERGLSLEVATDGPVRVRGDADRLRELLIILADNAIKYTNPGGAVRVQVLSSPGKATVRVSDTGQGIPPEALPRIFDRFYRVDKVRSRQAGGTGLGLSIARWIVEVHGGSITVQSTLGQGSTFNVELPRML